jgi:hypothetical protein
MIKSSVESTVESPVRLEDFGLISPFTVAVARTILNGLLVL